MSQREDEIAEYNRKSKEDSISAEKERLDALEKERKMAEAAVVNSVPGAWKTRREKWSVSKLSGMTKVLLQPQQL